MVKNRRFIFVLFLLIASIFVNYNNFAIGTEGAKDNVQANVMNLGYIARDGEWIYYSNIADGSSLYKSKLDGTGEVKLCDDIPNYINVVGDWIYYSNVKESFAIYKIKKDGTGRVRLNKESSFWVQVVDNWIYYGRAENTGQKIYRINTEGKKKTKVMKDLIYGFNVVGDWIYYSNESDEHKIYRIKTNGENKEKINEDQSFNINVVGNNIYYQNFSDGHKIYKVDINGKNRIKINNDNSEYMNISGDWIYYTNVTDNYKLYKMKADGSNKTKLNDEVAGAINIIDGYIYYWKLQKNKAGEMKLDPSSFMRIKKDGSSKQVVKVAPKTTEKPKENEGLSTSSIIIVILIIGIPFGLEVWKMVSIRRISKFIKGLDGEATDEDAKKYISIIRTSRIAMRSDIYRMLRDGINMINSSTKVSEELKNQLKETVEKRGIKLNSKTSK